MISFRITRTPVYVGTFRNMIIAATHELKRDIKIDLGCKVTFEEKTIC